MRALYLMALCAGLAACAAKPTPPVIETRVERVEVPTPVACVAREDIPAMPPQVGDKLTGNAAADAVTLAGSALDMRAALTKALALMQGCVR